MNGRPQRLRRASARSFSEDEIRTKPCIVMRTALSLALLLLTGLNCSGPSDSDDQPDFARIESESGLDWQIVWNDEFDYEGLPDGSKWNYEVGRIRNNEAQYYTRAREKNARVDGENLVIASHFESFEGADFTSASVTTSGKAAWTYGRIEVRAQLPGGRGMWPAIWMLGTNISEVGWPECGEIDIMEFVGFNPGTIHANIHTEAFNHSIGTGKGASRRVENPDETFHVYAVEWLEDRLDFYIDGVRYFSYEKQEGYGEAEWPFDKPQYLILNAAVGGSWGGQQGIDVTIFPTQYLIDYVRVYELVED